MLSKDTRQKAGGQIPLFVLSVLYLRHSLFALLLQTIQLDLKAKYYYAEDAPKMGLDFLILEPHFFLCYSIDPSELLPCYISGKDLQRYYSCCRPQDLDIFRRLLQ